MTNVIINRLFRDPLSYFLQITKINQWDLSQSLMLSAQAQRRSNYATIHQLVLNVSHLTILLPLSYILATAKYRYRTLTHC